MKAEKGSRMCCSCDYFHKGVRVGHSHCDAPSYMTTNPDPMKWNGRVKACRNWKRREAKYKPQIVMKRARIV